MQGRGDEIEPFPQLSSALSTLRPWHIPWSGRKRLQRLPKGSDAMNGLIRTILSMIFFVGSSALAQVPNQPLTFQFWKEAQVTDATNQMFKISARISQLRANKPGSANVKEAAQANLPSARVKTADGDPMSLAEKDLRRAKESLEAANSLELADYVNIYLPSLESQPDAVQKLIEKLPKEELGEILKLLLTKNSRLDTKRNPPVISGLSPNN